MHDSESDQELLGRYAATGGDAAFRVLMDRYSGLVFHTARRSLGDAPLAEDVSQRVFVSLAKKARQVARSGAPLPSWLHHATLLEAKSVLRTESRHTRRKEALMNAPADPPDSGDSAWRDALPHLDEAIDALPESDRHVLLLHFVNELTHAEIARRVGRSAAAVQKQSRRALAKLQQILGRRGIALTIGALTAGLTTEMTKAAPVILAPLLGTSIGKTTTSLFAVKKTTIAAIFATVLLCGVPLARQQTRIQKLEARITDTLPLAELAPRSRPADSRGGSQASYLQRLARDLKAQGSDVPRYVSAIDHVESLSNDELIALALEAVASSLPFEDQEIIILQLFRPLAKRDSELALDVLLMKIPDPYRGKSHCLSDLMSGILMAYSETNPHAALEWFERNLAAIRSIPAREGSPQGWRETELRRSLSYGFILTDSNQAMEILRPLHSDVLKMFFYQYVNNREPSLRKDASGYIEVARGLLPEQEAAKAIGRLTSVYWGYRDTKQLFSLAENILERYDFTELEVDGIIHSVGASRFEPASTVSIDKLRSEITNFKTWLKTRTLGNEDRQLGETLALVTSTWSSASRSRTTDMVSKILTEPETSGLTDEAVAGFLGALERQPNLSIDLETLDRISAAAADSEEVRAIADRIHKRYSR
jgi:RNA polymerase sigma factor (sigma-70 family)